MGVAKPSAVIFDLGNVLIDWDMRPSFRPHFDTEEEVSAFLRWFWPLFQTHVHDSDLDMTTGLAPVRAMHPELAQLIDVFEHRWNEFVKGPMPESVALLERLDERAVPLFALTNWPAQVWPPRGPEGSDPAHHDYGFLDRFQKIVVSGQVKMKKPDAEIYTHALDVFGLAAPDAVFIDDLAENIEAAEALGMTGLRFEGADKLETDLKALGFL